MKLVLLSKKLYSLRLHQQKFDKAFKKDSQRTAFLLCVGLCDYGGLRRLRYCVAHALMRGFGSLLVWQSISGLSQFGGIMTDLIELRAGSTAMLLKQAAASQYSSHVITTDGNKRGALWVELVFGSY